MREAEVILGFSFFLSSVVGARRLSALKSLIYNPYVTGLRLTH